MGGLKTSEYRHMGGGSKIVQKNRHMIFERSQRVLSEYNADLIF